MELGSITISCPQCTGTGVEIVSTIANDEIVKEEVICRRCLGETIVTSMNLDDDLVTLITAIKTKVDEIWDVLPDGWKNPEL